MAVNNVGRVGQVQAPATVEETRGPAQRRRLDLDQGSTFELGSGADLGGFVSPLDAETQAGIASFYARFQPEQRAQLQAAGADLGAAILGGASGSGAATGTASSALEATTSEAMATYLATTGADSQSQVGQDFMWMAIGGMESYLKGFADKMQNALDLTNDLRTEGTELRDMLSNWPDGKTQSFTWKEVTFDDKGNPTVTEHTQDLTKDQATELLAKLEDQQKSASDVSDLAKFDLQNKYQDYQQAVQTLAGIQKQTFDDAKAIINNLRA